MMQFPQLDAVSITYDNYYRDQFVSDGQHSLGKRENIGSFSIYPTAIDIDIPVRLFKDIFSLKACTVSSLQIRVTELQDLEKRIERIQAIENVFGMLNDLTPKQLESFEKSIKRRDLF